MVNLSSALLYKLQSMPRGVDHSPIEHYCQVPFKTISIDRNFDCFLCDCEGYLPIPVGKVNDFESIEQLLNSPTAILIQQDISDKKYTWCAVTHCGIKNNNIKKRKYSLLLSIDESCNLYCPSCRRDAIMLDSGPVFEKKLSALKKILSWLDNFNEPIEITIGNDGDPFASHIMRPLFTSFRPKETHSLIVKTNGLLLKKQLSKSHLIPSIQQLSISIDAGNKHTYENVRRPGKWESLIENLDYIKKIGLGSITQLNFVVQYHNYKSLEEFVSMCVEYGFSAQIDPLDDWGTWSREKAVSPDTWTIRNGIFDDHDVVFNTSHPDHQLCRDIVTSIQQKDLPNIKFSPRFEIYT